MNVRSYTVNEGLPQSQVMAVYRDQAGYLWVGTYSGPARYNGQTWTAYTHRDGMPGYHITSFLAEPSGRLWLGTFGHGFCFFDGSRFHFFDPKTPEGSCIVNQMVLGTRGEVWAATDQGLMRIDGGKVTLFTQQQGLPHTRCLSLWLDAKGVLYVGTQLGLVALVNEAVQPLSIGPFFQEYSIEVVIEDQERRLWVGTRDGLFYVEGTQVQRHPHPVLGTCAISNAALEPQSGIWFGTDRNGAFKLVGNRIVRSLSQVNGLSNPIINSMHFDREGTLWLGTDSSLCKYRPSSFVSFTQQNGLGNPFARTLLLDGDGVLAGTREGVYRINSDYSIDRLEIPNLTSQRIYDLDRLPDGGLAITTESSLALFRDGKTEIVQKELGQRRDNLRSCVVDKSGRIWVGADGLFSMEGGRLKGFPEDHPLGQVRILDLIQDEQGWIWAGTWEGLVGFHPETAEILVPEDQSPSIWDLALDHQGGLWIATNGEGLWHFDRTRFRKYTSENSEIGNDFIWQVIQDRSGVVWAGHNQGIVRLENDQFSIYTTSDGLVSNEGSATSIVEDPEGRIWFGTGLGISLYLPNEVGVSTQPPQILVEEVLVTDTDGLTQQVTDGMALPHDRNNLNIKFAGLSFVKEESITYRYFLEGLDAKWSNARLPEVQYVKLPPGAYRFKVKAANSDGVWSPEFAFAFTIKPAFHQRTSFRLLMFAIAIILVLVYIRVRLRLVERRNHELEILVQQRTEDLATKNQEFRELSLSDPLTRVRNRRYVTEMMREEAGRLKRRYFRYQEGDPFTCLCFMILDLDHFKTVNDRYGHDIGDQILIETAERLKRVVRDSDVVARWGGEEFLVVLRDIHTRDLPTMASKLLEVIRSTPFDHGQNRLLPRTTSLGFAYLHPTLVLRDVPWEWVLKLADTALYHAKGAGRNQAIGVAYSHSHTPEDWETVIRQAHEISIESHHLSFQPFH